MLQSSLCHPFQSPATAHVWLRNLLLLLPLLIGLPANAASVNLAWNANPEADIAGYKVHYGTASDSLNQIRDIGKSTSTTLSNLASNTKYFCAVQAYNTAGLTSNLSAQISFTTPIDTFPEIAVERPVGTNLVDGTASATFGNVTVGVSGSPVTFTVKNPGTANLTGLALTKVGTNSADFLISTVGASSLAPGASTTFSVTFKPTATGTRTATLRIASNDADENPFDITLTGSGVAAPPITVPEIAVERPAGTNLVDGTASAAFGNITVGVSGSPVTFTVKNPGTANLTGLALTKAGTNSADFLISTMGASSLAPGASTTFSVTFKPTATGNRSAILRIASNDADENPFDITLTGSGIIPPPIGIVPEIAVEQPVGTNLVDGIANASLGSVNLGSSGQALVFTVRNPGTANLSGLVISMAGANPADFKASVLGTTIVGPAKSTTFSVTFKPTAAGTRAATLRLASNDADENPFEIALTGNGVPVPEIAVENQLRTNLIDGVAKAAFASVNLGASGVPSTFTIRNPGTANLTRLAITASGANPGDFVIGAPGASTLAPGASTTFTVAFKPTSGGVRNAVLQIASNDADENPFDIGLSGSGVPVPEIAVENAAGTSLVDGAAGSTSFGNVNRGSSSPEMVFTLRNLGTTNLTGISIAKNGLAAADFVVSPLGLTSLAPGQSASLRVTFKPLAAGTRNAGLLIYSNDANERPFDIALTGSGVSVPEIAVEQPAAINLIDGTAGISFGNVNLGAARIPLVFTIRNRGTANLTGLAITNNGSHPADFLVGNPGATTLAPGAYTTFSVTFKPTAGGSRGTTLQIASNDADENPFEIALTGNGVPVPEIAVEQPVGTNLVDGTARASFGSVIRGTSSRAMVFTIRNSGTANLTGLAITPAGVSPADFLVAPLGATSLAPGASTTFSVVFKPTGSGARSATLRIASNDADENPFDIALGGTGVAVPEIAVEQPVGTNLVDGIASASLGSVNLGSSGQAAGLHRQKPRHRQPERPGDFHGRSQSCGFQGFGPGNHHCRPCQEHHLQRDLQTHRRRHPRRHTPPGQQ